MISEALKRLLWERQLRENAALAEREARRLAEVKAAFFEGMEAGAGLFWHERDPNEYWLESAARRDLYAGPPMPDDPSKRAAIRIKATHGGRRRHRYDPQRDPGRPR
jgi:hypothetical protein